MSFVERSIILCPYLGGSTIEGSTVHVNDSCTCTFKDGRLVEIVSVKYMYM